MIRQLIREILLNEVVTLSPKTDLYHRTTANLKPDDIIKGKVSSNRINKHVSEYSLENVRLKKFPDMPSRITGAFASLTPRSRFAGYGQLYKVALEPGDTYLVTDSMIIDKLWEIESEAVERVYDRNTGKDKDSIRNLLIRDIEYYGKYIIDQFWEGVTVRKDNLENIEILAPQFRVIEKIEEGRKIVRGGDTIKLGIPITAYMSGIEDDGLIAKMKDDGVTFSGYSDSVVEIPARTVLKIRSVTPGKILNGQEPWSSMNLENPWKAGEQTLSSIFSLTSSSFKSLSRSIRDGTTEKL